MQLDLRSSPPPADQLFALFESTGWNERRQLSQDQVHQAMSHSWHTVSAYRGDDLVGFGRLVSDGIYQCFICDMIVRPADQGQGIGTAVLGHLVAYAQSSGITWLQLTCAAGKQGFYETAGFTARPADAPGMERWLDGSAANGGVTQRP
ncbi:MAG: GNAT family N-acetyltransferase [Sulfobacillus sp.]